jgi:Ca-activated chloride channel homolog
MLLRNKTFPIRVLPVVLLGSLVFGQSSAQNQNPAYQPGQQGQVDGGVIQPIDENAKPAGQSAPAQNQPAQPQQNQQAAPPAQPPSGQQGQNNNGLIMPIDKGQQPASGQPATGQQQPAQHSPNQPSDTVQIPSGGAGQAPDSENSGIFVFKKQVEEVRLHATVVDDRQHIVTNLDRSAFTVYENGQPQQITSFLHEDVPVALGIVIDNSGSMRDKRPAVNQAALNLIKASNPQDEVFVVNFNDDYYLDQDYTDSVPKLKDALEHYETRGGTALYDAVLASTDHLMKAPKLEKRVLFVVTDGEDDASLNTLEQTIRKIQQENGPTIYTIGILDDQGGHKRHAQRALREMAESTGGVAFFPASLDEVDRITQQIAHDIRNQYTLLYKPSNPQSHGGYRQVKVEARARGFGKLQVRTRSGYYAGQQPPAAGATRKPAAQPSAQVR